MNTQSIELWDNTKHVTFQLFPAPQEEEDDQPPEASSILPQAGDHAASNPDIPSGAQNQDQDQDQDQKQDQAGATNHSAAYDKKN